MSSNTFLPKDAALRAIGRTVVNFQRLEHNLKLAVRLGTFQGTVPKIQRDLARRVEWATTLTLGQAIQAWLSAAQSESSDTTVHTPDLFDTTMQVTFSWGADAESQDAHGQALKALLEARNNLIHGGLVQMQWDSPAECERLIGRLNELNDSIATQMEFVTSILQARDSIRPQDLEAEYLEAERRTSQEAPSAGDA